MHPPGALNMGWLNGSCWLFRYVSGDAGLRYVRRHSGSKTSIYQKNMSKELEKVTAMIREQTDRMAENAKIELLDALAWWASEEAGHLTSDSPDAETYED